MADELVRQMKAKPTRPEREISEGNSSSGAYPEYLYQRLGEGRSLIQGQIRLVPCYVQAQKQKRWYRVKSHTSRELCLFLSSLKKLLF